MTRKNRKHVASPDGSWVLEGKHDSSEADVSAGEDESSQTDRRPAGRRPQDNGAVRASPNKMKSKTPEPELIMPSLTQANALPGIRNSASHIRARKGDSRPLRRENGPTAQEATVPQDDSLALYTDLIWSRLFLPVLSFASTVFGLSFRIVKPILAIAAAIWLITFGTRWLVTTAMTRMLSPLCSVPGMYLLNLPFCYVAQQSYQGGPPEFNELMTVQSAFEDIMASSASGVTLPLDMKRSESSIRDLKHLVQYSTLSSRAELVFEFEGFVETARMAASDLTKFNSRVGAAVDHVISTNRWTLKVIDGVAEQQLSKGAVAKFLDGTILFPFKGGKLTEKVLLEQYLRHTRTVESKIQDLIVEAQALQGILQNLDNRLDVIHGISVRDGISVKDSHDELFAHLWTRLGGNRSKTKKFEAQLQLLRRVASYRRLAWEHVTATMLKLESIAAGLEDLRSRVAAPDLLGPREDVPLRLHIDSISMAVERLDNQRQTARQVETNGQRRILDKAEQLALSG